MESQLYPNNPIKGPVVPSKEMKQRINARREMFRADIPALDWCIKFLDSKIDGLNQIKNIELDLSNPQAVTIQLASTKSVVKILAQIKAEMEKRMQEAKD